MIVGPGPDREQAKVVPKVKDLEVEPKGAVEEETGERNVGGSRTKPVAEYDESQLQDLMRLNRSSR